MGYVPPPPCPPFFNKRDLSEMPVKRIQLIRAAWSRELAWLNGHSAWSLWPFKRFNKQASKLTPTAQQKVQWCEDELRRRESHAR